MKIGTIYTLFGRRAGAELYFEKYIAGLYEKMNNVQIYVFCNSHAYDVMKNHFPFVVPVKISFLENQIGKAFWLEFLSRHTLSKLNLNLFWIPSGTNHFPGPWDIPSVVTFLDLGEYHVRKKYDLKRTLYRKLICIPKSLKRASLITSISHSTDLDLQRLFGRSSRVIYPGLSPREINYNSTISKEIVLNETGKVLNNYIFTPGRTDYFGKGLDVLLNAYKKFSSSINNSPDLVLVGPQGEGHGKFIQKINELQLDDKVFYLGRVSDECINALYANCCMVVIASRFEGFGFPVLEAMQNNVPIICSDSGSLPEVAGNAALMFQSGCVDDLFEKIHYVYRTPSERFRLQTLGQQQIKKFIWDVSFEEMASAFLSLVNRK